MSDTDLLTTGAQGVKEAVKVLHNSLILTLNKQSDAHGFLKYANKK